MTQAPDGRAIFAWNGRNEIRAETNRLSDAIAAAAIASLFNIDGALVRILDGKCVPQPRDALRATIAKHITGIRAVNRGSAEAPDWQTEFYDYDFVPGANTFFGPDDRVLLTLLGGSGVDGGLLERVCRGPRTPNRLTENDRQSIIARSRSGERPDALAEIYKTEVAVIRELIQR